MLLHFQRTIEELKLKVKCNISMINTNQDAIKRMSKISDEYAGQFEDYVTKNKTLLTQNNELINVQLTLINFINKYKDTAIVKEEVSLIDIYSITDKQEIFALTIKDVIPFDYKHPYFIDSEFIDKLIVFYESQEDYEQCNELKILKEKK